MPRSNWWHCMKPIAYQARPCILGVVKRVYLPITWRAGKRLFGELASVSDRSAGNAEYGISGTDWVLRPMSQGTKSKATCYSSDFLLSAYGSTLRPGRWHRAVIQQSC